MKIAVITGTINSLPLLQFLVSNRINISIYNSFSNQNIDDRRTLEYFCKSNNIDICIEGVSLTDWLNNEKPDISFVLGYKELINLKLLKGEFKEKIFNIHFGLLPDFKGPTPVFWQIKKGLKEVGMAIHRVNEKYDEGPVVWNKRIRNEDHFSYGFLEMIFSQITIEGVSFIINSVINQQKLREITDSNSCSAYYKRPVLKDVIIDWSSMTADEIVNLVKACNPWNKGASTFLNGNEIKIIDVEKLNIASDTEGVPGTIVDDQELIIICLHQTLIKMNVINLNGVIFPSRFANKVGLCKGAKFDNGGFL